MNNLILLRVLAELAKEGRINTLDITQANFESGEISVGVVWSFQVSPQQEYQPVQDAGRCSSDGCLQNGYASVINKYAPHPNAAALIREDTKFSDEGQTYLALAGATPKRRLQSQTNTRIRLSPRMIRQCSSDQQ